MRYDIGTSMSDKEYCACREPNCKNQRPKPPTLIEAAEDVVKNAKSGHYFAALGFAPLESAIAAAKEEREAVIELAYGIISDHKLHKAHKTSDWRECDRPSCKRLRALGVI